jgi:hypothetical protein
VSGHSPHGETSTSTTEHSRLRRLAFLAFAVALLAWAATIIMQVLIAAAPQRLLAPEYDGPVSVLVFQTAFFSFSLVGFLLARRRPGNAIGWLLMGVGLCWGVRGFLFDSYLVWTTIVRPESLPGAAVVGALSFPLWGPAVGLMGTLLILLFPDGRVPSTRWRPLAWISGSCVIALYLTDLFMPGPVQQAPVADLQNPFGLTVLEPFVQAFDVLVLLLGVCMVGSAAGLVSRFHRSVGIERLQLKWLALAGVVVGCGYLLFTLASAYAALTHAGPIPSWLDVASSLLILAFVLIPLSIGAAVLRHGLYGIDRLISRTVSYLAITFTLLVVYVVLVTLVSQLTPNGNSLAVATSTLAVAALFQPLRRRVQERVDRRFNRSRFDAERTLTAYASRLRDQVDLDAVSSDLLSVVRETLQPTNAQLWLRSPGR